MWRSPNSSVMALMRKRSSSDSLWKSQGEMKSELDFLTGWNSEGADWLRELSRSAANGSRALGGLENAPALRRAACHWASPRVWRMTAMAPICESG